MGIPVLILGESGTGKSASMRNFKFNDIGVINVAGKPLPFKTKHHIVDTDNYIDIKKHMKSLVTNKIKRVIIDDAQYLMANEFMRRATERGFDKFTEIAQNFWSLVNEVKTLPDDTIVYFMAHIERDANGNEKIKTIGKLLDEKITVEGMFTIVLKTNVTDGVYSFLTQNSGHDTVKSPIGMFPGYAIDNDLKYVDEKIRNYYELGEFLSDEELAKIDEEVKHADIPIKEEKKKRGRKGGEEKKEEPGETPKTEESEEKPKRKSRNAEVKEAADEYVKEANELNADKGEEVPFEDYETPEKSDPPKRKRRAKAEETAVKEPEKEMETPEEQPRRRRRRTKED